MLRIAAKEFQISIVGRPIEELRRHVPAADEACRCDPVVAVDHAVTEPGHQDRWPSVRAFGEDLDVVGIHTTLSERGPVEQLSHWELRDARSNGSNRPLLACRATRELRNECRRCRCEVDYRRQAFTFPPSISRWWKPDTVYRA